LVKTPRPIIFRLLHRPDRKRIWQGRKALLSTKYRLSEDYKKDRNLLKPILTVAKAKGATASLMPNKIKVDGKIYGVNQIKDLPPQQACERINDSLVCFFGRTSSIVPS
jgi:hypothetical protein